jgi:hypothetical protein
MRALAPGFFLCVLTKNNVQENNTSGAKALIRRAVYGPTKVVP